MAYLDTSVLAAYYCPEPLSAAVQEAIARDEDPVISRLVEVELYSAVARKVRVGELDTAPAGRILSLFREDLSDGRYRIVPLDSAEYETACRWIAQFTVPLRSADGLHLAATDTNGLTIATSDGQLARAAGELGVDFRLIA